MKLDQYHSPESIERILPQLAAILKDYYAQPEAVPVIPYRTKKEALEQFFEPHAPREGLGFEATLDAFRDGMLKAGVRTWHPMFFNQMTAGVTLPAVIGELLASMLNCTLATWEMTPAATIVERNVTMWMAEILGMPKGSSGVFLPGGSLSNQMALMVARDRRIGGRDDTAALRHITTTGAIFCAESCHYSITNSAHLMGIAREQVVKVATNERGEMLFEDLVTKIDESRRNGLDPFVVVATLGLTVTGGFDPLEQIAEFCKDQNIHLHVDAAFGGGIAFTSAGPQLLKGIQHADTVIWDAHKWFHAPLTSTVLLAPDARLFREVFSSNAHYLFHPQEEAVDFAEDMGHFTLLCGKRFDALTVWVMFKTFGEDVFRELAESRLQLVRDTWAYLDEADDFKPAYQPVSPIICFRYMPERVASAAPAWRERLHRFVREEAKKRGLAMFNISKLKGEDHFRMILINPLSSLDHVKGVFKHIRVLAQEFIAANPPIAD